MRIDHCRYALAVALLMLGCQSAGAQQLDVKALERDYASQIKPIVKKYCHDCHSGDLIESQIDFEEFPTWADVRKHPSVWQKVGVMLDAGTMPPADAAQPTEAERALLARWVHSYLSVEAIARAGDPGRVVLRRLSNTQYTNTLRDLTGIATLDPAREFPVDGAAGEGFTNTGASLVMSPALVTKYLDAGKEIATHAVLLPDGFRFSPHNTRRDWTDETIAEIRQFYRQFTDAGGSEKVNLQGIVFDTNEGGRLPVEKYVAVILAQRETLAKGGAAIQAVAAKSKVNAKYLGILWTALNSKEPSPLLDGLRARVRAAKPEDTAKIVGEIAAWQKGLFKFGTVGHIGKVGGPKAWLEPVDPLTAKQEIKFKLPVTPEGADVALTLLASDAGDGAEHDFVVWQSPRLVAPGRPDVLLRDVRVVSREIAERRARIFASVAKCLNAAAEAAANPGKAQTEELAKKYDVDSAALLSWLEYLGVGTANVVNLSGHFKTAHPKNPTYDFISGWGSADTPLLVANSSDQHVRIPGNMKPHSVAVHPSPTLRAAVGWRSPVTMVARVDAVVTHAHPECGNGVTWALELRHGSTRQRLADGIAQGGQPVKVPPINKLNVQAGDLISLLVGPRDGNHSCDLTAVDFKITAEGPDGKVWDLGADVSPNVMAANPHADKFGNDGVWHFYSEPEKAGGDSGAVIAAGSLLAKWQAAASAEEKAKLAADVQKLLVSPPPTDKESPDAKLYRQLTSIGGPLLSRILKAPAAPGAPAPATDPAKSGADKDGAIQWGLDPALFGKHPDGTAIDPASLCVKASSAIEVHLPAELAAGCELVVTGVLDERTGKEGSVQLHVVPGKAPAPTGLTPSTANVTVGNGTWSSDNRNIANSAPVLANENSAARKHLEASFEEYRNLFPAVLCYTKIVPVDEVVTLTLIYREDQHLVDLMLDDKQKAHLDRLWNELHYISQDAITLVDAFAQLMEYATQDADPKVFEPMRGPINARAAAFRKLLVDTEPKHIEPLLTFAAKAYRRPLIDAEKQELRQLYRKLREQEIPHDEAFRLTLARVLVAPAFLYRVEKPVPGSGQGPVTNDELANRLSYFLWASAPDDELRQLAASGRLSEPGALVEQTRRMLRDPKTRRLATEFGCYWLHIADFDRLDEKSEQAFPTFNALRGSMYEESVQFFTDLFQKDGSVLDILDADYTFLNEELAKHYGIAGVTGAEWRRVDGVKKLHRGGILAQATTLATQSGASRTSPILRGNWINEVLLGDRLPRPPKGVPPLPDDESAGDTLSVRQLVEKHTTDAKCSVCHKRIDPFGFSLESFDAIGRYRDKDVGGRAVDTKVKTMDGAEFTGLDGMRNYMLTTRRDAFVRQFCKKLLGYSLGRSVQLSDEPLLVEMQTDLKANNYKVLAAVDAIVRSRQFREIRGQQSAYDE